MSWQCVNRAKDKAKKKKKKVETQRLKILNYGRRHLLAYIEKTCVKFTEVREESNFHPGCVSVTFHYRGSEAEAC